MAVPVSCRLVAGLVLALAHLKGYPANAQDRHSDTPCGAMAPAEARLVEMRPGLHTVTGRLADFDPCHKSVRFEVPPDGSSPPLVIFVHGGGGAGDSRDAMWEFRRRGVAVLGFDAYETNGFKQPSQFWANQVTNEARQRMIYRVALGAVAWGMSRPSIDRRRVFVYGLSNGADVALNLASVFERTQVRGIFAEGIVGSGIGLPDTLKTSVKAIFGRLDDYGATTAEDWRWLRRSPCIQNNADPEMPPGNAAGCNRRNGSAQLTQAPIDWLDGQRAKGSDVDVWFYDAAAHGIFTGPLQRTQRVWGTGSRLHSSTGAEPQAKRRLLEDVLKVVAAP